MSSHPRSEEGLLARVARGLLEFDDLASFRSGVLAQVRGLVDCDHASYNEIAFTLGQAYVLADPPDTVETAAERLQEFPKLVQQNPLVGHYLRTGDPRTLRLSDFIVQRKLRALELYDVVYRHTGTEYQAAFTLPDQGLLIGIALNRSSSDFDERDLSLLDGVREVALLTHRSLEDRALLDVVTRALETDGHGPLAIFVLPPSGSLRPVHQRAEVLLREISADPARIDALQAWARQQRRGRITDASVPLRIECGKESLEAHYRHGPIGGMDAVVVRPLGVDAPTALCSLGLTRRQAEVLHLVHQGATNAEIALGLCISAHTVRHHLEDIYRRIGVNTRAAASHLAGRALSDACRRLP